MAEAFDEGGDNPISLWEMDCFSTPALSEAARSAAMLKGWWRREVLGADAIMDISLPSREGLEEAMMVDESALPFCRA